MLNIVWQAYVRGKIYCNKNKCKLSIFRVLKCFFHIVLVNYTILSFPLCKCTNLIKADLEQDVFVRQISQLTSSALYV